MPEKSTSPRPFHTFLRFHLPVILYGAAILSLSSLSFISVPKLIKFGSDKLIHFAEYALFAVLVFRSALHLTQRMRLWTVIFISVMFVALFAIGDEYLQSRVRGRTADLQDVAADLAGGCVVIAIMAAINGYNLRRRNTLSPKDRI